MPVIAVLGAAGLIGSFVTEDLLDRGFAVVAIGRRFTRAQKASFGKHAVECPIATLSGVALTRLLDERDVDMVVNCLGVLQDGGRGSTDDIHRGFTGRLLAALAVRRSPTLLIHMSIPGRPEDDGTRFSRTKRQAEGLIAAGSTPFVILRPGFVVAPAAYGGSALVRAFAALAFKLPGWESERPFATTDARDIAHTIAFLGRRWRGGESRWAATWDVMERQPGTLGDVVDAFRRRFGGPGPRIRLPSFLMSLGARAGDLSARLGWAPPIRTTALEELRRGVEGDPAAWIAATGIQPSGLSVVLARLPSSVQERWFARLYLLKAGIIGGLALFWVASGCIALSAAFGAATAILTTHGFPAAWAQGITTVTSLADIAIGVAIAIRKNCRTGLCSGIAVSIVYMVSAVFITPELWIEPLGALVKTGPAIILMLVALLILDDR